MDENNNNVDNGNNPEANPSDTNSPDANTEEKKPEVVVKPPVINIMVAADKMNAYVRVTTYAEDQKIEKEDILKLLEEKKIANGILEAEIEKFCESGEYKRELKVAKGLPPVKGPDGTIEFHFRREVSGKPSQREDGSIDFKSLDLIQNVKKDDLLCTITLPGEGEDGVDVYNQAVKAKKGDMPYVPSGDNIEMSENDTKITAKVDGGIRYKNGHIQIEEIYTIRENVGPHTGNIDFNGSVVINGSVLEGFEVNAKDDVTIKGMVEGGNIKAGGNILVKNGIQGIRTSVIEAAGNITSAFIENATLICGGTIYSDIALNSHISAGDEIILRGKKGLVRGGEYKAGKSINVKSVGNAMHISQTLAIDPNWYELYKEGITEQPEDPEIRKHTLLKQKNVLNRQLEKIARAGKPDMDLTAKDRARQMKEMIVKKSKVTDQIAEIDKELDTLEKFLDYSDLKIVCVGELFTGTKLMIGRTMWKVSTNMSNQKYYMHEGEIISGAVLPHEANIG